MDGAGGLHLTTLDWVVIAADLTIVLAVGLAMTKRTKTGEDLFLAGRSLHWIPVGLSTFAANISSTTLVGLAGAAYATGISVTNYEWISAVVMSFFAVFVVPLYSKSRVATMPEFLERRFDHRSRSYFSALSVVTIVCVDTAGTLYAGALVLKVFFPSLEILHICAILALIAGIYTTAGGLAAVAYNDMVQSVVLLVGSSVLSFFMFDQVGFSWDAVTRAVKPEMLSMIRPLDDPTLPWLGTVIGIPVLGFYFWCTNQFIVQRVLAARSLEHARWGALLAGLLKLPVFFIMVLPGTMALVSVPGLSEPDQVFPTIVANFLPAGLAGLVIAGLIAAVLSSLDATLSSVSTLITLDFIQKWFPEMTPRQTARAGRISLILVTVIAVLWASTIPLLGKGLFEYLQSALSHLVPPVVAVFAGGLFWKRASATGALVTMVVGHVLSMLVFVLSLIDWWPLHFTINAGLLFAVSGLVLCIASLRSTPPSETQVANFTYDANKARELSAPFRGVGDYRLLSVALLLLTAWLVLSNW